MNNKLINNQQIIDGKDEESLVCMDLACIFIIWFKEDISYGKRQSCKV